MDEIRKFAVIIVCAAMFLTGCAARISEVEAGPRPHNYKATLKAYIVQTFFDPYSMRSVAISEPVPGRMVFQEGWIVCLQANAKNRMGGYVGVQRTAYLFQGDQIVVAPGENAIACEGVPLSPWPEMEGH